MTDRQPDALRLADEMERNAEYTYDGHDPEQLRASAAELRRLHAVEKESNEIIDQLEKAINVLAAQTESALASLSVFESLPADWQQRIEAMKADAERFRWLLDTSSNWGICDWDSELCEWVRDGRMPEVVRKAIDAARGKT